MAGPAPVYASRGDGRTYTAPDRRRSGKTSTPGGLTDGHLKLHPNLHQLDGRSQLERLSRERQEISNQRRELDNRLTAIDREFQALEVYQAAKTGRPSVR